MSRLYHESIAEDTMTMFILGKGPSAKKIQHLNRKEIKIGDQTYQRPSRFEIAAINDSWQLVDQVDYAFMIDYFSIELLKDKEIKTRAKETIKRLVIPTYPQVYQDQQKVKVRSTIFPSHPSFHIYSEEYQNRIEGIPYYLFQMDGSPIGYYGIDSLAERPVGTAYAAASFAIARGFKHFILSGFDPIQTSSDFYNKELKNVLEVTDDISAIYPFMYIKLIEKILSCGCSYENI